MLERSPGGLLGLDIFKRSHRHDRGARAPRRGDRRRRSGALAGGLGAVLVLAVLIFGALALVFSRPAIVADAAALARVEVPLTGGTVERVTVTEADGRAVPLAFSADRLWPRVALAPGQQLSLEVVLRRPGWIGWLAGSRYTEHLALRTPSAQLRSRYVTLAAGSPLRVDFSQPVRTVAYGEPEHLRTHALAQAQALITLARGGEAGSIEVAAAPRTWERLPAPTLLSWFPAGARASAVLSPNPGSQISPATPLQLTFSEPISDALGRSLPRVEPATQGSWRAIDSHTLVFTPRGYGYGLDTNVAVVLPGSVRLAGGVSSGSASVASWTVPPGSSLRVQQLLAELGYLPLRFSSDRAVARTAAAQERAAIEPPAGHFSWRYGNTPGSLQALWQPGTANVVTRGALMAFENDHELTTDGIAGPAVWHALIGAALSGRPAGAGYTYVMVSEGSQSLALWNDGSIRLSTPVNTGIASAPTELGTYPVYEHIASGTMSGTNPDGSHYEDPGIPWISYFNGGDALHGFERAQYGFPQSLGCVEMPPATAGRVWPYTPIGTLVHIE